MSVQPLDIFISHASEDKEDIARPLAEALRRRGFVVWYDEYVLRLGDSLRQVIDKGLSSSRFGVVILSPSFFSKEWPQRELNGLLARETVNGSKVLLPVWHRITFEEIAQFSPLLADKFAVSTARGLDVVVRQILEVVEPERFVLEPNLELFPVASSPSEPALPMEDEALPLYGAQAVAPTSDKGRRGTAPLRSREPMSGEERVRVDGTVLLYVPGGEYVLGAEDVNEAARPVHRVVLSPFWIAKYPVTNEQYYRFLGAHPNARKPEYWNDKCFNQPKQPVVGVSWEEARAYCWWAGLRLPSEAQWEVAARGTDGRRYPWGDTKPTSEHANFGLHKACTTPVGSYPNGVGPFGTLDQAGNIWEWCEDVWNAAAYRTRDRQRNPLCSTGDPAVRCLRGGSWNYDANVLAVAHRNGSQASNRVRSFGFRCLLSADSEP
jgi:formylglycine-generating enzyme required for sulfatase activity